MEATKIAINKTSAVAESSQQRALSSAGREISPPESDVMPHGSVVWRRILAALVHTAPLAPVVAIVMTVATYEGPPTEAAWATLGTALLLLLVAWVGLSLMDVVLGLSKRDRVDAYSYRMLQQRYEWLKRDYPCSIDVDRIGIDLEREGPQWVSGEGYEDLWQRVHWFTDEAIVEACPDKVLSSLNDLTLRVTDSAMGGAKELLKMLDAARDNLEKGGDLQNLDGRQARQAVSSVWKAIHGFRDGRWNEIRRISNSLLLTTSVLAMTGYAMVWLVILLGASQLAVQEAAVLMLIGAFAALVGRLHTQSKTSRSVEDYGLSLSRLLAAPILGAIAAVMGVLLVAGSENGDDLQKVFESSLSLKNVVIAAGFGLSPHLLLDQLKKKTEEIKAEIESTQAGESQSGTK